MLTSVPWRQRAVARAARAHHANPSARTEAILSKAKADLAAAEKATAAGPIVETRGKNSETAVTVATCKTSNELNQSGKQSGAEELAQSAVPDRNSPDVGSVTPTSEEKHIKCSGALPSGIEPPAEEKILTAAAQGGDAPTPEPAPAMSITELDTTQVGKATSSDAPPQAQTPWFTVGFNKLDLDGDGVVTADEYGQAGALMAEGTHQAHPKPNPNPNPCPKEPGSLVHPSQGHHSMRLSSRLEAICTELPSVLWRFSVTATVANQGERAPNPNSNDNPNPDGRWGRPEDRNFRRDTR